MTKNIVLGLIALVLLAGTTYYFVTKESSTTASNQQNEPIPVEPDGGIGDGATPLPEEPGENDNQAIPSEEVLGESVDGHALLAYHYGSGEDEILLVGGLHGGYSWNTTVLMYEMMDYFAANENMIPDNLRLTIIPVVNPDGLKEVVGSTGKFNPQTAPTDVAVRTRGRFNTNDVDLNRNFDCNWAATSKWQSRDVSGGSAPTSEPEAKALRDYVAAHSPVATLVWFSAEGKVYPSACEGTPSRASSELATNFAQAANYPVEQEFDAYQINGDFVNWMAKQNIPGISVLLTDYTSTEWTKNKAGVEAVLKLYGANETE